MKFAKSHVAVVGDLMMDRYIVGEATRISPEAPVPVLMRQRSYGRLGGAGNVALNLKSLGCKVSVFGVVGSDHNGRRLRESLFNSSCSAAGVYDVEGIRTTVKTRVLAGRQQLVRIDDETPLPIEDLPSLPHLMSLITKKEVDGVVFADYGKGVITQSLLDTVVQHAQDYGAFTALDPNERNPVVVKGLGLLKPNLREAMMMTGLHTMSGPIELNLAMVSRLRRMWTPFEEILVTLGAGGMMLIDRTGQPILIGTKAKEVYDVCGAGDTALAVYTAATLSECTPLMSAELANTAAGIVVGKVGTALLSEEEVKCL